MTFGLRASVNGRLSPLDSCDSSWGSVSIPVCVPRCKHRADRLAHHWAPDCSSIASAPQCWPAGSPLSARCSRDLKQNASPGVERESPTGRDVCRGNLEQGSRVYETFAFPLSPGRYAAPADGIDFVESGAEVSDGSTKSSLVWHKYDAIKCGPCKLRTEWTPKWWIELLQLNCSFCNGNVLLFGTFCGSGKCCSPDHSLK